MFVAWDMDVMNAYRGCVMLFSVLFCLIMQFSGSFH
jgi:hypothetical protein